MTTAAMGVPSRRAEMWYAPTVRQGRWSVGFRLLLGIPHYVVLFFLFVAMVFVAIIGWFAALFTGRLPLWAHTYIGGVIRWDIRVNAYVFLLTDHYPPFSFDDEDYPARPFRRRRMALGTAGPCSSASSCSSRPASSRASSNTD